MSRKICSLLVFFLFSCPVFANENDLPNTSSTEKVIKKDVKTQSNLIIDNENMLDNNTSRYGFLALWEQSDWVARGALIILLSFISCIAKS